MIRILTIALLILASLARPLSAGGAGGSYSGRGETVHSKSEPYTTPLALSGYSPVSYIESRRAEPGLARHWAEHDGVRYLFTSAKQRRAFLADPERYLPAYGGYCAFGCSVGSEFVPDPTSFEIIDGRTHLFLRSDDVDARRLWRESDVAASRAKADAFWRSRSESRAYVGGRNVPASGVGLGGYSPVSYFTTGRPEKGDPRYSVEHNGVTYHLTSEAQVEMFKDDPAKFEPQCGGWCAFGMSIEDKFPIDPTKFRIIDDRLYLFLNNGQVDALDLWRKGEEGELLRKAHAHWKRVAGE